ncbi:protein YgfX [Gilvimarinus sp. DA14]|uniref:protein YgfX n=1 Tax=Gilvimarinus sp. DA14 TaxID=2956798 RepID=UPI003530E79D
MITQVSLKTAETSLPRHFPGRLYLDADILPSSLQRRFALGIISGAVFLTSIAFIPLLPEYWSAMVVVFSAELVCGIWCLRPAPTRRLRLDHKGWALAEADGVLLPVSLEAEARVWPWLVTMGLRYRNGRRLTLLIMPDSLPPADYLRLRIWLVTQVKA